MTTEALEKVEQPEAQLPAVPTDMDAQALIRAVGMGDVSALSPEQRLKYVGAICRSVGLNPLTLPIRIIQLDGRDTLYATAECGAQLRNVHKVSLHIVNRREERGVYIVTAKATRPDGREDEATGAVPTIYPDRVYDKMSRQYKPHPRAGQPVDGMDFANAIKKAETQAKRRAALSICGLGIPDESELSDMKQANATATVVDQTETATDRAALLNSVVSEPQPESPPVVDAEILGQDSRGPSLPVESSATTAPRPSEPAPPITPPAPPVAEAPAPAASSSRITAPAAAPGTLTEEVVRNLEVVFSEHGPICGDFLVARGYLQKGQSLASLDQNLATRILNNPKAFFRSVDVWAKTRGAK